MRDISTVVMFTCFSDSCHITNNPIYIERCKDMDEDEMCAVLCALGSLEVNESGFRPKMSL